MSDVACFVVKAAWVSPQDNVRRILHCLLHFLLRGLPKLFRSVEILGRISSSLPPCFVSGHLAAVSYTGHHPKFK